MKNKQKQTTKIAIFEQKEVRRVLYKKQWHFAVEDVVLALIDSANVKDYINKMRARDQELSKGYGQIVHTLEIETKGGKQRMNCANLEGIFRIIQSIPSKKAEPFKRWLAAVGKERVDEIQNPELAMDRMRNLYEKKGYPKDWIDKRVRSIAVRKDLTDEWKNRGAEQEKDYEILTAEISKACFGIIPSEYKKLKGLKLENLRDHMDDFELILTMLSERTTTEIHRTKDSRGVPRLKDDARVGGQIAGGARKQIERKIGRNIVSKDNFLQNKKKIVLK